MFVLSVANTNTAYYLVLFFLNFTCSIRRTMRSLVTRRASGHKSFKFKTKMEGAHILIVICQLWHAQPHHLSNILEEDFFGKTSEPCYAWIMKRTGNKRWWWQIDNYCITFMSTAWNVYQYVMQSLFPKYRFTFLFVNSVPHVQNKYW